MHKKRQIFLVFVLLSILFSNYAHAQLGERETPVQKLDTGSDFSASGSGTYSLSNAGSFTYNDENIEAERGTTITKDSEGNIEISNVDKITISEKNGNEKTVIRNAESVKLYINGNYEIGKVKNIEKGNTKIINGIGVKFKNGELTAERADSFIKNSSIVTNVKTLKEAKEEFSVKAADSIISDCIRLDNIKDSEFKISNKIEITTKSNVSLKITDCSFNEYIFSGMGRITIDKTENPIYVIENGTLTKKENGFNETIESDNYAIVETDKTFGFKCINITPAGSYFYNSNDLRKDFNINVPKESSSYRLCLRKNTAQQFNDYDGLADFVDKRIELNKIVNYLRYPLKNNQISGILGDFVYRGLKDVNALISYDNDLIFLNEIFLNNKNKIKNGTLSVTYPSNYYTIKEMEVNSEIHGIIELNPKLKKDLTQNINYGYKTDYLEPKLTIKGNVLIQDNGKNKLLILPPENEKIDGFLR